MKTKILLISGLALIIAGSIFWSCQKDETLNNSEDVILKKAEDVKASEENISFNFSANPLCFNDEVTVIFNLGDENLKCGKVRIDMLPPSGVAADNGEDVWSVKIIDDVTPANGVVTYTFIPDELGYYKFRGTSSEDNDKGDKCGIKINGYIESGLLLVEDCSCEGSFSYSTADNLSVVFEYTSDENVDAAVVELTCPHILASGGFVSNDGKTYTVNNEKNQTVLTWTGDLTACVPVTFNLTFIPDCEQNGNHANIWTDFKVNEISKKGLTVPEEYCKKVETTEGSGIYETVCEWPIIKYNCK